jgi:YD repeat-containing protein
MREEQRMNGALMGLTIGYQVLFGKIAAHRFPIKPVHRASLACVLVWIMAIALPVVSKAAVPTVGIYQLSSTGELTGAPCPYPFTTLGEAMECIAATLKPEYTIAGLYEIDANYWDVQLQTLQSPPFNHIFIQGQAANITSFGTNRGPCIPDCPGQAGPSPQVGNPITLVTGNKYLGEAADFNAAGPMGLNFSRYYNSQYDPLRSDQTLGPGWLHSYSRRLDLRTYSGTMNGGAGYIVARIRRPEGKTFTFSLSGATWYPESYVPYTLESIAGGKFKLTTDQADEVEVYDSTGKLESVENRYGVKVTLAYGANSQVSTVTDHFGRTLSFIYNAQNRIQTLTDPANGQYQFTYDANGNLETVTFPDLTVRRYHYENGAYLHALTGITDENTARFSTYTYYGDGRAETSQHAGGADYVRVQYGIGGPNNLITDALGYVTDRRPIAVQSLIRISTQNETQSCATPGTRYMAATYDSNGYIQSRTDSSCRVSNFAHDTRGLQTQRVEAVGTAVQRTISTEWHPTFRLVKRLAEPKRLTSYVFNGEGSNCGPGGASTPAGLICSKTIQATTDGNGSQGFGATLTGTPRSWTYTYNAEGQVLTEDGPRTDVADVTAFTYHASNGTCPSTLPGASTTGCRGQVNTITNALTHVTTIDEYNAHGQPLRITDPNGLVTTLAYDARQRITSRNVGGELTAYEYWPTGLLKKVTNPDASFLQYTYDDAHRLTQIEDSLGNKIAYTLDAMGNRTREDVKEPLGATLQTLSREYNNLNRLMKLIGGTTPLTQITQYGHDNQGNVTTIDGPLAGAVDLTTNTYDALNRLTRITSPVTIGGTPTNAVTEFSLDGIDQVTKVKDPRNLETNYTIDGLGNRTLLASPDTGNTTSTYDAAGNLLTQTDAKGQLTSYTHDALNRVSTITYQGTVVHTYQYDQGAFGKGRLTKIIEPNSTTDLVYDIKGRLVSESRTINAIAHVTSYGYDGFGRMNSITYPGGRQVNYTLDSQGRVQQITTSKGGAPQVVVSNVQYRPFGPVFQFNFGNGQAYTRGFDMDGRIALYTLGVMSVGVSYDDASRITKLAASGQSDRLYEYDELDRLTRLTYGPTIENLYYDVVGNRTRKSVGLASNDYQYEPTSNRLASITGTPPLTYIHDSNGAVTNNGVNTFGYDTRGRMSSAISSIGTSTYQVNSVGQRIRKTNVLGDTVYHYDAQGRLIAEGSPTGTIQKEYIHLGNTPVAVIQ